ncbi:beta-conglycinin, beta chain-like [Abrus precatorius]|uniref:Beta-conglycinin, beta chain-like n=1 Tax=Abrus precatorius TaxID=3816 RepID=A0A8B8MGH1_ABRPR|nr:beta-conglycinin, beta chain-like [Abrus precatorius]
MKARFPLLLLLGIVFLASVSVSFGFAYWENESPSYHKCLQSCKREQDAHRQQACLARCKIFKDHQKEEEHDQPWPHPRPQPQHPQEKEHEEEHQHHQKEEEHDQPWPHPRPQPQHPQEKEHEEEHQHHQKEEAHKQEEHDQPWPRPRPRHPPQEKEHEEEHQHHQKEQEHEKEPRPHHPQEKEEHQHHQKEEEHEQEEHDQPWPRPRPSPHHPQEKEHEEEHQHHHKEEHEEEHQHHHKEEESEEGQSSESKSQKQKNPFHFRSNRFRTLVNNEHGYIRVLQRFDQRSNKLHNLRNYRIIEYKSKPSTLVLPHHSDADFLLVVAEGSAILTFLGPQESKTYILERGDALRIPAGTTFYMLNRDNNQNLRVIKLAIPVNKPGKFTNFYPSNSEDDESFFRGFSENILEASFDTPFEKIKKILLEDEKQEEGAIVEVSKEQVRELSKHAKSSSRKTISSEDEPFNLRTRGPIYSNKFGKFFEIPPHKNPQLQELDIFLSCVEIEEGGLLLPHYNSKAIVVLVVNKGKAKLELVGLEEQQQKQEQEQEEEEEQEGTRKVQSYRAKLSEGDIFVIPASHPVAINASTDFHIVAFGINAENNQRNFLAGEKDNVIRQIHKQVMVLAFPGSGQQLEKLLKKQSESYFVDAQPQQSEEGKKSRKDRLSSILNAFY